MGGRTFHFFCADADADLLSAPTHRLYNKRQKLAQWSRTKSRSEKFNEKMM